MAKPSHHTHLCRITKTGRYRTVHLMVAGHRAPICQPESDPNLWHNLGGNGTVNCARCIAKIKRGKLCAPCADKQDEARGMEC